MKQAMRSKFRLNIISRASKLLYGTTKISPATADSGITGVGALASPA